MSLPVSQPSPQPQGSTIRPLRPAPGIGPGPEGLRRVFVRDLVGNCLLGIHAHEKGTRQRVRLNVELAVLDEGPPAEDAITNVVCYEDIADGMRRLLAGPHINLVETLAETIARFCFEDTRVVSARVRVEKLDVFSDAAGAGVEIERIRLSA